MIQEQPQKHFVFIIGTRAQLIKVAPVVVECEKRGLDCTLLMTGQHLETMQDLLDEFGVRSTQVPAITAKEHATIFSLAVWLPCAYRGVIKKLKSLSLEPKDIDILVHGDTLSTVLGALAGRRIGARVVHLESGLTSKKILDPFPEEISRRIVFKLSHIAMCPTQEALEHMKLKYPQCEAVDTGGNTILDAINLTKIDRESRDPDSPYIVVSLHRFKNIYDSKRFSWLAELLEQIASIYPVYFVLHPATRKRLIKSGIFSRLEQHEGIKLLPRLGYSAFLRLAAESTCVLTDGGSNQEELAALGVPTIVMRQATERSDGLGRNAIMEGDISDGVLAYISNKRYVTLEQAHFTKHDGKPSAYIINYLISN